jgi:hypothetical protein
MVRGEKADPLSLHSSPPSLVTVVRTCLEKTTFERRERREHDANGSEHVGLPPPSCPINRQPRSSYFHGQFNNLRPAANKRARCDTSQKLGLERTGGTTVRE